MALSLDPNAWYSIQNFANDGNLNWQSDATPYSILADEGSGSLWQVADYGSFYGSSASGAYVIRSQNDPDLCLAVQDGTPTLLTCDATNANDLEIGQASDDSGDQGSTIYTSDGEFLEVTSPSAPATVEVTASAPTDSSLVSLLWTFNSVGAINDDTWSTVSC